MSVFRSGPNKIPNFVKDSSFVKGFTGHIYSLGLLDLFLSYDLTTVRWKDSLLTQLYEMVIFGPEI